MQCNKCKTENQEDYNYCFYCGLPLQEDFLPAEKSSAWILAFILFMALGVYALKFLPEHANNEKPYRKNIKDFSSVHESGASLDAITPTEDHSTRKKSGFQLSVGQVVFENNFGIQVPGVDGVIVSGSWIALPLKTCLGNDKWSYFCDGKEVGSIHEGIWSIGDIAGLWKLGTEKRIDSPELSPWSEDLPLFWLSFKTGSEPLPFQITASEEYGNFLKITLPDNIDNPGVFIQKDNNDNTYITGWTFGKIMEGGLLWIGPSGSDLEQKSRSGIDDFYNLTFAHGREEQFSKALSMSEDETELERLKAFAEGFRLNPALLEKDTPYHLKKSSIIKYMRLLISNMMKQGLFMDVSETIDDDVLASAADAFLLMDVVKATVKSVGFDSALQIMEGMKDSIDTGKGDIVLRLDTLHLSLYKKWIQQLIEKEDTGRLRSVITSCKKYFPDDPEIRLFEARLSIMYGDWRRADKIISSEIYPSFLDDRKKILEGEIVSLKSEEGKIAIHFRPGDKQIVARVRLNRNVDLEMLVDTGASTVLVPYAKARDLGIDVEKGRLRQIDTVGGKMTGYETVLSTVELEGWTEHDVSAIVVDLPYNKGYGLLGLNYLRRFDMSLDNEKGSLLLTPK